MQRHIAILVSDGFTDSGLSIGLDIFRTANALVTRAGKAEPFRLDVASARGGRVHAASGVTIEATRRADALQPDVLIVPGLWMDRAEDVGALMEAPDVQRLVRTIAAAHARGAIVGSSCSGAFLLADAGLLDGRDATTTWWLAPALARRRPRVRVHPEAALIVGRRLLTAGAVFAQADVALHLVAHFIGPALARQCAKLLLLDTHASQAPYMAAQHLRANDPVVLAAERWIRAHLPEPFAVQTLAARIGTSPRTLARRLDLAVGLSPVGFVQRIRVEAAILMLETSSLSLEEISARVGYSDASTLSRLVRRETKASPREFRRRGLATPALRKP